MSTNLKENQLLAAQLLATGKSGKMVAEAVGVTEETISRWRQDKDFKIYMMELLVEAHEAARTRLQSLVDKAVTNIEAALDEKDLPTKDKFAISVKIIELCNCYNSSLDENIKKLRSPFAEFDF